MSAFDDEYNRQRRIVVIVAIIMPVCFIIFAVTAFVISYRRRKKATEIIMQQRPNQVTITGGPCGGQFYSPGVQVIPGQPATYATYPAGQYQGNYMQPTPIVINASQPAPSAGIIRY